MKTSILFSFFLYIICLLFLCQEYQSDPTKPAEYKTSLDRERSKAKRSQTRHRPCRSQASRPDAGRGGGPAGWPGQDFGRGITALGLLTGGRALPVVARNASLEPCVRERLSAGFRTPWFGMRPCLSRYTLPSSSRNPIAAARLRRTARSRSGEMTVTIFFRAPTGPAYPSATAPADAGCSRNGPSSLESKRAAS